jgi:hypothetical protein
MFRVPNIYRNNKIQNKRLILNLKKKKLFVPKSQVFHDLARLGDFQLTLKLLSSSAQHYKLYFDV